MKRLETMKDQLESLVQCELSDVAHANTHEVGEAIDMIKDLSEAIYYCTITKAMKEKDYEKGDEDEIHYYMPYPDVYNKGKPYYNRRTKNVDYEMPDYYYREKEMNQDMIKRDPREGKSPMSRKTYIESHELHKDSNHTMKDLEHYMQELTDDILDMIKEASPEEKQVLKQKIATLSTKIA